MIYECFVKKKKKLLIVGLKKFWIILTLYLAFLTVLSGEWTISLINTTVWWWFTYYQPENIT